MRQISGFLRACIEEMESVAASPRTALFWASRRGLLPAAEKKPLAELRRILVVKPDEIGDFVLATPFLRELRRLSPQAHITLVVKPDVEPLAVQSPFVNHVVPYRWDLKGLLPSIRRFWSILLDMQVLRRDGPFDLAVLPRWDADHYQAVQWLALSGAARRVSYASDVSSWKHSQNLNFDEVLTDAVACPLLRHEVVQNLDLLRYLGGQITDDALALFIGEDDPFWAEKQLARLSPGSSRVAIALGARQAAKRWPGERFREFGERLLAEDSQLVILGDARDRALGDWGKSDRVLDLRGAASLAQSAAALQLCDAYVGNDTGLKHIAAAWGKPVLELSCHPTTGSARAWPWPDRFRAWGTPSVQVRPAYRSAPCTDGCVSNQPHCICAISVDDAWSAWNSFRELNILKRAA